MDDDSFFGRLRHSWNAFLGKSDSLNYRTDMGPSYSVRPDRYRPRVTNERSIVSSILTRISIDAADNVIRHVRLDANDRYLQDMDTGLAKCFKVRANIDQPPRAFIQDMVQTLLEEGSMAILPTDLTLNPDETGSWDVINLRVGRIVQWYSQYVKVNVYDENPKIARRVEIDVAKSMTAIVENPLYSVMNEPNSTLQRLIRKLNLLDVVDEQSSSGKLDIIIQLPYVVRSQTRKDQAEERRKSIEMQLKGSQYGIAYTDSTEKITQLNRPAENNLLEQVTYLTNMLYGQLGITEEVMNGTADEATMLNYKRRTIRPIMDAIVQSMYAKFLTDTARTQKQSIIYFSDPFASATLKDFAEIADKLTRNEVVTSNELRTGIGMKPSTDPKADKLGNPNMPLGNSQTDTSTPQGDTPVEQQKEGNLQDGV